MSSLISSLYEKVGALFYSIAIVDGKITGVELEKLKELVKLNWLNFKVDINEFEEDEAFKIVSVFDWMMENNIAQSEAFLIFTDFFDEYQSFFTKELKIIIFKTAEEIAYSFNGLNKSELTILFQLQKKLIKV